MADGRQDESMRRVSKFLALILRHRPEAGKLSLSREGWAEVGWTGGRLPRLLLPGALVIHHGSSAFRQARIMHRTAQGQ